MSNAQTQARHQQQIEHLCAAAIRALSSEPDLHFRGRQLYRGRARLAVDAPHLHPSPDEDFGSFRGAADGMALRLKHSDDDLHRRLRPAEPVERLVFEMLEQFRVEALPPAHLPGVVGNLRHRHIQWSLNFHHAGLTETARGLVLYTVAQICRSRVTGEPVVERTQDLIEQSRAALAGQLGQALAGLRQQRHDQTAYAEHALAIACAVGEMLPGTGRDDHGEGTEGRTRLPLLVDDDEDSVGVVPVASSGQSRAFETADQHYRVFTTDHDRQQAASALIRPALLRQYRQQLDRRIAEQHVNLPRLARELTTLLAEPARNGWDSGQEEGHIDARRLSRLVTSPTERRLFRTERIEPVANCLVTFLIDCSGSMAEHAESLAMLVDVFARALELAGADSEVLGFTTASWNGGRAMRDWRRAGRPHHPGRLNERRHIVFKDADTAWRRARPDIAALLKTDLFKEGADGEAVTWACERGRNRTEEHRLLIVLSDGSPMDSATNLTNDEHYLDNHLTEVVRREELAGSRIYGLGVGLDLSPYYNRSHALDLSGGIGNGVFREILGMIAGNRRR